MVCVLVGATFDEDEAKRAAVALKVCLSIPMFFIIVNLLHFTRTLLFQNLLHSTLTKKCCLFQFREVRSSTVRPFSSGECTEQLVDMRMDYIYLSPFCLLNCG